MNETLAYFAESLRGRRVQFALGGLGFGAVAIWLIGESSLGVPAWVTVDLVALSPCLFVVSWTYIFADGE